MANKFHSMIVASVLFAPQALSASNPDSDPMVARLREHFKEGTVPTVAALKLSEEWSCVTTGAMSTSEPGTFLFKITFRQDPLFIIGRYSYSRSIQGKVDTVVHDEFFVEDETGLLRGSGADLQVFRVMSEGTLVYEHTCGDPRYGCDASSAESSIARPGIFASAYGYCVVKPDA